MQGVSSGIRGDFARIPVRHTAPVSIQAKLTVDAPDSLLEREADRIADQVMRMPSPASRSEQRSSSQKTNGQNHRSRFQQVKLQRKESGLAVPAVTPSIYSKVQALKAGSGRPLSESERAFFEPRFGRDFSNVRIHTDHQAASTANELNAKAFTIDNRIVFGPGEFTPNSASGQRLIAHELVHTLQQSNVISRKELTSKEVAQADAAVTEGVTFVGNKKATMYSAPDKSSKVAAHLSFGERLRKLEPEAQLPPGWVKCSSVGFLYATTGYVDELELRDPPRDLITKDPGLSLYKVTSRETFWGLVKRKYGIRGNESTADLNINHFINAIRAVNKKEAFKVKEDLADKIGNFFIPGRDASDTELKTGVRLWIPSFNAAVNMDVGSGTVTGEVSRLRKQIAQKMRDFATAAKLSVDFIDDEFVKILEEFGPQLIKGLVTFAIEAAAILGASTAIGALIGSLAGGAGAIPGAEIGFEIGLIILKYYGIYELVVGVIGIGGLLLTKLTEFVGLAWTANGDQEKLTKAGQALATALAVLGQVTLTALLAYLTKKGTDALKGTKFAQKVGESNITKWVRDRQSRASREHTAASKSNSKATKAAQNKRLAKAPENVVDARDRFGKTSSTGTSKTNAQKPGDVIDLADQRVKRAKPVADAPETKSSTVEPELQQAVGDDFVRLPDNPPQQRQLQVVGEAKQPFTVASGSKQGTRIRKEKTGRAKSIGESKSIDTTKAPEAPKGPIAPSTTTPARVKKRDLVDGPHAPNYPRKKLIDRALHGKKAGPQGSWKSKEAAQRAANKNEGRKKAVDLEPGDGEVLVPRADGTGVDVVPAKKAITIPMPNGDIHTHPIPDNHPDFNLS